MEATRVEPLRMQRPVRHFYKYPFNWVDEIFDDHDWKLFYDSQKNQRILTWAPPANGVLVERLELSPGKEKGRGGGPAHWMGRKGYADMWVSLPDDLMTLILARLPFSSFCSVRSVCTGWNALMAHPDPIMRTSDPESRLPLAVMFSVQDCWACYNPLSHKWHHLPVDFATSSNGCGGGSDPGTRVVAGSNGLLLVASTGTNTSEEPCVLWAVNPVNRSARQLVPPWNTSGLPLDCHLLVDDKQSSFKCFQTNNYGKGCCPQMRISVYDSETNSWSQFSFREEGPPVWSIVEFKGIFYTFGFDSAFDFCTIEVFRREPKGAQNIRELIDLPTYTRQQHLEIFRGGRLFVRDGRLLLAGVLACKLEPEDPGMEAADGMEVGIWEMEADYDWKEIAFMPEELNDVLWTGLYDPQDPGKNDGRCRPQVDVQGDFMWVANPCLGVLDGKHQKLDCLWANCGIMCHIPSNSWWQVSNYWDSPNCKLDASRRDQMLHLFSSTGSLLHREYVPLPNSNCQPFLFSPCIDLIA